MIDRDEFLSRVRQAKQKQEQQLAELQNRLAVALDENADLKTALELLGVTDNG